MSLLTVSNLTKTFAGPNNARVQAVSDVSFTVDEGEIEEAARVVHTAFNLDD